MTASTLVSDGRLAQRIRAGMIAFAMLAGPLLAVFLLRMFPQVDVLFQSATFHLVVISGISAFALIVAIAATRLAARANQPQLTALACGCLTLTLMLMAHGLVTPGIGDRPGNVWVARLPVLAIAAFAISLTVADVVPATDRTHRALPVIAAVVVVCGALAAVIVIDPTALAGSGRLPGEVAVLSVLGLVSGLALLRSGLLHWRRWRLGASRMQFALTAAAWMAGGALVSLNLGTMWRLSWWDYHAFLLAGFAAAAYAVIRRGRETTSMRDVLDMAFIHDPMEHIEEGYPETLRALVAAVEAKDAYTHGHSARVAELAVRLGIRMRLGPDQLRALARGAYLHDIGKIGIPDEVLNKAGALDDAERKWIEQHPIVGFEMVRQAPSLREALAAVRHHHERYDGNGYPDGLGGDAIPLVARICTVADVWDALTSDRAYRLAMTPQQALAHIMAGRATHFDPRIVDCLVEHLSEQGIELADQRGDAEVAARSLEACHAA